MVSEDDEAGGGSIDEPPEAASGVFEHSNVGSSTQDAMDIDSDEEWGFESGDLEDALQQASETPELVAKAISSLDSSKDYDISRESIAAPSMEVA